MKHLPKHLRPRWRYVAIDLEAHPDASLSRGSFQRALWYAAGNLLGDAGSADADLKLLTFAFDDGEGEAVVRARHGHVGQARAAIACVSTVNEEPVGIHVRGISGTVRACEERYMGRASREHSRRNAVFAGSEYPVVGHDDAVDVLTDSGVVGATQHDLE